MKKIGFILIYFCFSFNSYGQISCDSIVKYILIGINEKRVEVKIPPAKLDEHLNRISSELIDIDIKIGGSLNEDQSYEYIYPKMSKTYDFGDVRYSYVKMKLISKYYPGIEQTISKEFFETYDKYNSGEYFVINSKNKDLSDGNCHLGLSVRLVNDQIFVYYIIYSETQDDFVEE